MYFSDWTATTPVKQINPRSKVKVESTDDCVIAIDAVEFHCPNKNCNKVFNWRSNLTRHMKYECGKSPRFRCSRCDYQSPFKQHVLRHASAKHPNQLTEAINQQHSSPLINSSQDLQPEQILSHQILKHEVPTGQFMCGNTDCGASFTNLYALNYHTSYLCDKTPKYQQVSIFNASNQHK